MDIEIKNKNSRSKYHDDYCLTEDQLTKLIRDHEVYTKKILSNYVFRKNLTDFSIVEDAWQTACLKALKHRTKYNPRLSFTNWFNRIAINALIDEIKTMNVTEFSLESLQEDSHYQFDHGLGHNRAMDEAGIIDHINNKGNIEKALSILESLPDLNRDIFLRYEIQGESIKDIASDLNMRESYVRTKLHKTKKHIQGIVNLV